MSAAASRRKKRPRSAGSIFPISKGAQTDLERRESMEAALEDSRMVGAWAGGRGDHGLFADRPSGPRSVFRADRARVQHAGGAVPGAGHLRRGNLHGLPASARADAPHADQRMLHSPGRAPGPDRYLCLWV